MVAGILRFEWRYQTRRLAFAAVAAFFAVAGFGLASTGFGGDDVHVNSPYSIALSTGLASLFAVLATTFFCAQAALRDPEHRMAEIVYATAIGKRQYVFGRYAGAAAATAAAFAFLVPGLLAGTFAVAHDASRVGPFRVVAYLWPAVVLALPNLLLACAVLFAVALLTRSTLATYVGGVLGYVVYFVTALFSGSPLMAGTSPPSTRGMAIAAVVDPFGLSAFFAQTRYWTAVQRDERLLALDGPLLANRLLWLVVTVLVLVVAYRRFAFRLPAGARGTDEVDPTATTAVPLRPTPVTAGSRMAVRAFASATRIELRHAFRSWALAALLVGWAATATIELVQTFRRAELGTALFPATSLVLGQVSLSLSLFGLLVLVYYAAELVWRERTAGMHEIVDATPVPSGALLLAKVAALGSLLVVLVATTAACAMVVQVLSGWYRLEPALYLSLLLFVGLPLLFVAVLAVAVQALVPNRYLGILVSALVVVWWHRGSLGGPEHPLLRFAAAPEVPHSELAGFGPETLSFAWLSGYWGVFVLLLLAVVCGLWRRGTDAGLRARLASFRHAWSRPARWLAAGAALVWMVLGALVFQQTNRWNVYRTPAEVEAWQARYERAYRRMETLPQPAPVDVRIDVDLYPEERRYDVRGSYRLENRTTAAIPTVWVMTRRDLAHVELRVGGRAPTVAAPSFGAYRFDLAAPLLPGERTTLDFDLAVVRRGAEAGSADRGIVRNGSFLLSTQSLPSIGYRKSYEIDDPAARRRQGLPVAPRAMTLEAGDAASLAGGTPVPFTFEATVTTSGDQIALAPGTLLSRHERDGRAVFHYRAEGAMSPLLAIASGRYAVARRTHAGVGIEVYYHPGHETNVEAMLDAAARSLDYCVREFGPYPHRELRIVESPSSSPLAERGTGFAVPGTIYLLESRAFLTDRRDPRRVDVVTKRIAHEVAHQWWGHLVSPAPAPGASTLVETLARYTELRVLASLHGEEAVPPVLAFELDRYLAGRTGGDEVPLAAVDDQAYVYYAKGSVVMAAIRDLVGERAVNDALRRLVDDARSGRQPSGDDLVAYLKSEAPERHRAQIEEWWGGVVLYELRVASARATPVAGGRRRLDVRIDARKSDYSGDHGVPLPFDEELEVAVYDADPGVAGDGGTPIHRGRYRVRQGATLALDVPGDARWVVVDPGLLRIDANRADNVRAVAGGG